MKNISTEVSIFCLWTNWIHLVTCRDRILWATLLQSLRAGQNLWNLHFRSLFTGVVWPKIIFGLWRRKKRELENNLTTFETCVFNPFRGQNIKEKIFSDEKSRGPLLAKAALKHAFKCFTPSVSFSSRSILETAYHQQVSCTITGAYRIDCPPSP